ncbi:MAG TPA: hypothetical protein VKU87_08535, partial [Thermomicrobiaceae bacterium]|nr:hypothetical protein [Thermomicrobiaceae bacterium]
MSGNATARQTSLMPPDAAELTHLVRENVRLLAELTAYFDVSRDQASLDGWTIRKPGDVADYLGPELIDLVQEQLRIVMLNSKNQVLGVTLVY